MQSSVLWWLMLLHCKCSVKSSLQNSCITDCVFKGLWITLFLNQGELHIPSDWTVVKKEKVKEKKKKVAFERKSDRVFFLII